MEKKRKVLIDTNIIIDFLRGVKGFKKSFLKIEKGDVESYFSTITEAELFSGKSMNSLEEQNLVISILNLMKRIEVSSFVAQGAGFLRRTFSVDFPDALIVASALENHINYLVTRNVKHFSRIGSLKFVSKF